MNKLNIAITAGALLMAGSAFAGDPAAGEKAFSAKGCVGCHGKGGSSPTNPTYPALNGKTAEYISQQLTDYKSGKRQNPTMNAMAAMLNDAEVADVAAYLGSQK